MHVVGFGLEPVDVLAHDHDRLGVVHVGQHADRGLHFLDARDTELRQTHRLGRDRAHVVGVDRLRGVLDHVENVVHLADELVDVVAVERRDERACAGARSRCTRSCRRASRWTRCCRRAARRRRRSSSAPRARARPCTSCSACSLNRSKNRPSRGMSRPNMLTSEAVRGGRRTTKRPAPLRDAGRSGNRVAT